MPLTQDPEYVMYEYACHEGNYAIENILSAGRAGTDSKPATDLLAFETTDFLLLRTGKEEG